MTSTTEERINGHDRPTASGSGESAGGGVVRRAGLTPLVVDVPSPGVEAAVAATVAIKSGGTKVPSVKVVVYGDARFDD